jgi:plasmid stabilization system protein ParE
MSHVRIESRGREEAVGVKFELIVRPRAEIDLASHFLYLSEKNPQAALRFEKAIEAALKKIHADPQIGARLVHPKLEGLDIRFYRPKGFRRYLILFRITSDIIYITRILHGAQDIESELLRP